MMISQASVVCTSQHCRLHGGLLTTNNTKFLKPGLTVNDFGEFPTIPESFGLIEKVE